MGTERNAFFGDFAQVAETEYLKSAAVSQYGSVPVHELVQAAGFFDESGARRRNR